jgi:hypothetical protein
MIGELGPEQRQQFGITRNAEPFDPLTNARAARKYLHDVKARV